MKPPYLYPESDALQIRCQKRLQQPVLCLARIYLQPAASFITKVHGNRNDTFPMRSLVSKHQSCLRALSGFAGVSETRVYVP